MNVRVAVMAVLKHTEASNLTKVRRAVEKVLKGNPNHDERGRFAAGQSFPIGYYDKNSMTTLKQVGHGKPLSAAGFKHVYHGSGGLVIGGINVSRQDGIGGIYEEIRKGSFATTNLAEAKFFAALKGIANGARRDEDGNWTYPGYKAKPQIYAIKPEAVSEWEYWEGKKDNPSGPALPGKYDEIVIKHDVPVSALRAMGSLKPEEMDVAWNWLEDIGLTPEDLHEGVQKHLGPGPHPDGSSQMVHAGGADADEDKHALDWREQGELEKACHALTFDDDMQDAVDALIDYTDWAYETLNRMLRGGVALSGSARLRAENIDKAFHALPRLSRPTKVLRSGRMPAGLQPGDIYIDDAYISTYSTVKGGHTGNIEIDLPAGSRVAAVRQISKHPSEDELLLPRGSKFRVVSFEQTGDPKRQKVHLEHLPEDASPDLVSKGLVRHGRASNKFEWQPSDLRLVSSVQRKKPK